MIAVPVAAVVALGALVIGQSGDVPEVPDPDATPSAEPMSGICADSGLAMEDGLTPDAVRVVRCVKEDFPGVLSFGGLGDRPANVDDDHQTGRAIDIMLPGGVTRSAIASVSSPMPTRSSWG